MSRSGRALPSVGLALGLMLLLGACVSWPSSSGTVPAQTDTTGVGAEGATATVTEGTRVPLPMSAEEKDIMPTENVSPGLQGIVDQALADLADRLAIEVDQIEVLEANAVVWPDGSLGCPQPGMAYTQVQQEGYLIRLQVDKRVYDYHGGGYPDRGPFLCEGVDSGRIVPPSPSLDGD